MSQTTAEVSLLDATAGMHSGINIRTLKQANILMKLTFSSNLFSFELVCSRPLVIANGS